ncbi:MAG TPA: hypothetical protein VF712_01090 [Thermoleophilaceae bacterium]|jgi:pyruvate/2-oxoglutarate dehydrogenase complex dihydrolipoamide acyltransferase (E2) component
MAVPRPLLIALVGLTLLIAAFLATRNSQSESVTPPATPTKPAAPQSGPAAHKPSRAEARAARAPKPQPKPAPAKPKPQPDVPPQVRRAAAALAQDNVVVFFFTKPGAADDTGARIAVSSLEGMKGVKVFKADIAEVGAYRPMLAQLEISQVPATAIVRPGKRAVLLQGFVDAGTLRQNVADAQR